MTASKDDSVYTEDIIESVEKIFAYTKGKTKEEFFADGELQDAVLRRLEIIGEAAKRISSETRAKYGGIPWKKISGIRDVIIHEYDTVDLEMIWNIIQARISELAELLRDSSGFSDRG